jgi:gas vesicle protein
MATKEYLDEERIKLWAAVESLQQELSYIKEDFSKRTPEFEAEVKQSSRKASEYRNKTLVSKDTADQALSSILSTKESIETLYFQFEEKNTEIKTSSTILKEAKEKIEEFYLKTDEFDTLLAKKSKYEVQVNEISNFHEKSEDVASKLNVLYNSVSKKKKEVDDLHIEIFGYDEPDPTGINKHIDGLKDELKTSLNNLENLIEESSSEIEILKESSDQKYKIFLKEQSEKLAATIAIWHNEYSTLSSKIKNLLPDALTAGLSSAFEEKRKSEIQSGEKLSRLFNYSILGLIAISLIPFFANVYFFNTGKSFDNIIQDLPNLLAAILPLYIPLVWLAYSANKKSNLSKRLVEEYTHKEVLSKTFEGLSNQIESIEESSISTDLRIKLLYNLLDVSSENPGKLISNYNTSDHPLIDVLKSSSSLEDNVTKLEKIPGISKIAKLLNDRSKRLVQDQKIKIESGIDSIEN